MLHIRARCTSRHHQPNHRRTESTHGRAPTSGPISQHVLIPAYDDGGGGQGTKRDLTRSQLLHTANLSTTQDILWQEWRLGNDDGRTISTASHQSPMGRRGD